MTRPPGGGNHTKRGIDGRQNDTAGCGRPVGRPGRVAGAEGPGARRGRRGRHHRRRAPARPAADLRQRGLRAHDRLRGGGRAGPQLPVPPGAGDRPGGDGGNPGGARRAPRVPRRDPELPQGRDDVLEPPVDHARPGRVGRGDALHRRPVGRHGPPPGGGRPAPGEGGAGAGPEAGGARAAGAAARRPRSRPARLRIAHAFHPCDDLAGDGVGVVPLPGAGWGSTCWMSAGTASAPRCCRSR